MTRPDVTLEFWHEFASPYCYLSAARIEALAAPAGVRILWQPFLLGPIFRRRAHQPSPSQDAPPDEARYRRRDIERLCADYRLKLTWPSGFPRISLLGARVALLAADEAWVPAFTKAVYHASFAEDRDIGAAPVIAGILADLGQAPADLIAQATTPANKARLVAQGEDAMARGIFGAPSFVASDGELFWGNDRLEQAIAWAVARSQTAGAS
jgi:2-hydroxychromene-2-carboxylate isomerase